MNAPHTPKVPDAAQTEQGRRIAGMFGKIARWYDFLNHFLSLGLDFYWRKRLVRHVQAHDGSTVIDLAAGTMDVTMELLRSHGANVLAMDYTLPMLQAGKHKLTAERAPRVLPVQADGRLLPVRPETADAVTIAFGIRNIVPREAAYEEILAALRPGGRLCILEFGTGRKRIWKGVYNFYLHRLLPLVGHIFSGDAKAYRYLADTIAAFPAEDELAEELKQAGFENVTYEPLASGIVYIHVAQKAG